MSRWFKQLAGGADDEHDGTAERSELVQSLAKVMRLLQLTFAVEQSRIATGDKHLIQFCTQLERVFLHGIKEQGLFDAKRVAQANAWWDLLQHISSKHAIERLSKLYNVHTTMGKCRGWMRLALNESTLESYLTVLLRDQKLVREYYDSYAVMRSDEDLGILITLAAGLSSVSFSVNVDDLSLDQEVFPSAQEPLEDNKMRALVMPCYADDESVHAHNHVGGRIVCEACNQTRNTPPASPLARSQPAGRVGGVLSQSLSALSSSSAAPVDSSSTGSQATLTRKTSKSGASGSHAKAVLRAGADDARTTRTESGTSIDSYHSAGTEESAPSSRDTSRSSSFQAQQQAEEKALKPPRNLASEPAKVPSNQFRSGPVVANQTMFEALIDEITRDAENEQAVQSSSSESAGAGSATSTDSTSAQSSDLLSPVETRREHSLTISVLKEAEYGGILQKLISKGNEAQSTVSSVPFSTFPVTTSAPLPVQQVPVKVQAPTTSSKGAPPTYNHSQSSTSTRTTASPSAKPNAPPPAMRGAPIVMHAPSSSNIDDSALLEALDDDFPFHNFVQQRLGHSPNNSSGMLAAASSTNDSSASDVSGRQLELNAISTEVSQLEARLRANLNSPSLPADEKKHLVEKLVQLRLRDWELRDSEAAASAALAEEEMQNQGHHFKVANYSVPTFCDQCSSFIWGVYRQGYRCQECGLNVHKKCMGAIASECPSLEAEHASYQLSICPENGLDQQDYKCFECHRPIGFKGLFAEVRTCDYSGKYYCDECHWNGMQVIPARVIHNWDFKQYKVSKTSKQLLTLLERKPILLVERVNPKLFNYVEELRDAKKLREQLCSMRGFIVTCRNATKLISKKSLTGRMHLIESSTLYSLQDLLDLNAGTLLPRLEKFRATFFKHITSVCELCQAKGFICESCEDSTVLYPFQQDTAACPRCFTVMHRACYNPDHCPKCERIERRKQQEQQTPSSK
ncbi:differentially expressed in FDCP 8 [Capsaspora owczarzaki ATCC 30864]|uniref:Differentially expressed in FDCP 8 n=1 Tax=Capsaspora owczarzaki (strain ATCC 30864) TaxID=595528 RepID=A0A0D2X512_CAPO3|nr:differentially expressed in FDCP 8 [Capsaspora owczarzaki ATCC 30864]KJE97004.1 differentially expressed in FDCP 8 [Capsaspora owczarzaki ATCC 30864]|eukprot:XP_004343366.1 differentially expressed in FDCP 8 [Capsaspora owczarzaki ATCC 30864]